MQGSSFLLSVGLEASLSSQRLSSVPCHLGLPSRTLASSEQAKERILQNGSHNFMQHNHVSEIPSVLTKILGPAHIQQEGIIQVH